ncbi:hypothetical protein RhiirA1_473746 [Rhizophagus irregularis]|uniref:Uncharacterized protein n=1 Tax=Rhizophagus irregularis TaxID=588596 RepID=A0A2N0QZY9_9GLOM|nr:hypothetical protein RhiirA1_473746 [Rhizophagus irregularis]
MSRINVETILIEDSYENRMESLTVHNYDGRIQNHQELRSMILSQKPKQTTINLILNLTFQGWKKICNVVIKRFGNSKDAEYRMMRDLLDNSIPLTLDIYAVLFRSGFFEGYLESVAPLIFLSDVFYWTSNNHPIINILKNNLPIFNDYFVENFHSSIRNQTAESNSIQQIIQKAKIIDAERTNNFCFVNSRNPIISHTKLDYLEKKTSLFLLSLFDNIYHNIGNTQQINKKKYPNFCLPTFDVNVDVKVLPLAWNTKTKPFDNKFCDAEKCLLSNNLDLSNNIVLTCGHAYHKQCLDLLKNNFEDENNNNLNEDNNDENIENILERIESNIDNQFEISYQT